MLTALVTVWAVSLVVLAALLALVIVAQGTYGAVRRLSGSWRARSAAQPLPAQPLPAQPLPAQPLPAQPLPAQPLPAPARPALAGSASR